jgi:hypothetical protein
MSLGRLFSEIVNRAGILFKPLLIYDMRNLAILPNEVLLNYGLCFKISIIFREI